ncbi:MAG: carboxypeptidase regulatory-like domain-containing protein [Acidobacteria bacterium]|nr:carboxypeptidase regulatory-like domain-containing protein [Acidobacteriota bacterium]
MLSAGLFRCRPAILLAVFTLLSAGSAPLGAQVADGVIEIAVVDESNQVMPGVTVTVTRPDTGFQHALVTDATGTARAIALQPGTYDVKLELAGFATIDQKGLTLRVGQTARVSATMKVAQVAETVNVVAEASLVDVYKTDSSTNIVPEQIQELPVANRDFQSLAFLAPGVQRERGGFRFITNQPVIGAGGNASQSTVLVDGVDFTDATLGLARARFSQDAIGEFRVIANRFDTEIGGSAGGALSIVTKSGTNDVRGSAFAFFRDDSLREKGKLELQKNDYSRQQFGGTVGGPVVKDRTHFFLSFEQVGEDSIALFRPGGAYKALAEDITVPFDQSLFYGGADHRIGDDQNLRVKAVYERYRQENFRVGGFGDESSGMRLDRDNWNITLTHAWTLSNTTLNQLSVQVGQRKFEEPNNSSDLTEFFTLGQTLITGANLVGDQRDDGKIVELRDTFFTRIGSGAWAQDIKVGGAWQYVNDTWNFPVYPQGLMLYLTDTRALPVIYYSVSGSGEATIKTHLLSGFIQDDFRPSPRLTISAGLRYDLDTDGNNPGFTSPMMPEARGRDTNNLQPRAGFSWDIRGNGSHVVRGGAGMFTGRFLLVPAFSELQQNGYTGRIIQQRWSSLLFGNFSAPLNAASPSTTGIPLARDAVRLADTYVNPRSTQATAGYTARLGRTGLFADFEGVYVKGDDEIIVRDANFCGNDLGVYGCRVNKGFAQINTYTNEGRSEYKAFVTSVNGTLKGGHVVTASFTVSDKKNINDDFSPALVDYPNDPANIEAEYGRSRADERYRFVASGVFRLPYGLTASPIFEYGSGQPWNRRRGYDYNGDGKLSDRLPGVGRFSEEGPEFKSVNLRLTYKVPVNGRAGIDLIAEAFNLFNTVNYDVNSVVATEYRSGPTLANPNAALVPNPDFRKYLFTLPPREFQLGARVTF